MIEPGKLFQLKGGQRRRKLALTFGALERDIAGIAEKGNEYNFSSIARPDYTKALIKIVLKDSKLPLDAKVELQKLIDTDPFDERRACNYARNQLLQIIGTFPAEWDLVIAPHNTASTVTERTFYPGVMVYAEDIRSPFNLGSIFRTAEAMGAEKVFLSPFCTDPNHPRAIRSGMGCIENIPWERCALNELPKDIPIFVLETGGTPINEFKFPKKGIVIIGSEELGVSPEALNFASGCVSIPMKGMKASLNVGVAFGIVMQSWITHLK
ncbi:MAG: RNA methyltransferase [Treponema sp. CETP13]|nr:MAG: RNA methyltransferase [Treponema sp. CETP13]